MDALILNIKKAQNFDDLLNLGKKYKDSTGGRFLVRSLAELKGLLNKSGKNVLSKKSVDKLRFLLDQNLDQILAEEEVYLPVLGTSAAVSPLVGLFGTVWGLVHAFVDISQSRSADIAVVAPGIAEALTTTLAGLMVAIPALTFFHYFSNELRKMEHQLAKVSDKFLSIVKQTFEK
jgi:biopolymer transport protein TolQ